jgi:hypothetical protein
MLLAQRGKSFLEGGDAPSSRTLEDALPLRGRMNSDDAPVPLIRVAPGEAILFQAMDDSRHRRRANLFGGGELAKRLRAAEDEDGEGREARGAETAGGIFASRVAKRVDGC